MHSSLAPAVFATFARRKLPPPSVIRPRGTGAQTIYKRRRRRRAEKGRKEGSGPLRVLHPKLMKSQDLYAWQAGRWKMCDILSDRKSPPQETPY